MTESIQEITRENRESLASELLCLADTKRTLGNYYGLVLPNGRSLTDFNAIGAFIQEELGHARSIYRLLEQDFEHDQKTLELERRPDELHGMEVLDGPPQSWVDFVTLSHLVENAIWLFTTPFLDTRYDELSGLTKKIGEEERFHQMFTEGWLEVLSEEQGDDVEAAMEARLPMVLVWFGPTTQNDDLFEADLRTSSIQEIRTEYIEGIESTVKEFDLTVDIDSVNDRTDELLQNGDWLADRRRIDASGPDGRLEALLANTDEELSYL